jgi:membrane protease YdiL (CAAX protease family)
VPGWSPPRSYSSIHLRLPLGAPGLDSRTSERVTSEQRVIRSGRGTCAESVDDYRRLGHEQSSETVLMNEVATGSKPRKWPVFMRIVLFWFCYMAILVLAWMVKAKVPPKWGQLVWGLLSSAALLLITMVFLRWEGHAFRDIGLNIEAMSVPRAVAGIAIGLGAFAVILSLVSIIAGPIHLTRGAASPGAVVLSSCAFLALACMEELGFRGYALSTLVRTFGMWRAQAIVAVAFGLAHVAYGWSWTNILLGVMPWAIVFGMAATSSRGLAMPIGVHAGVNFAQWAVSDNSGIWKLVFNDQLRSRIGSASRIIGIAVALLLAFLFWCFQRKRGDVE